MYRSSSHTGDGFTFELELERPLAAGAGAGVDATDGGGGDAAIVTWGTAVGRGDATAARKAERPWLATTAAPDGAGAQHSQSATTAPEASRFLLIVTS